MNEHTALQLIEINRQFYQSFAKPFSETRGRVNPGVARVLDRIDPNAQLLDLGCGNGSLVEALVERGFAGRYVGVDFSAGLLAAAREKAGGYGHFRFQVADLTAEDWKLEGIEANFDVVLLFATLHHIPAERRRLAFLKAVKTYLKPQGRFIHSHWQFLNSDKLSARVQDWARVGLTASDVDASDYLLDWRAAGEGLRYVHHFSEGELRELAKLGGFEVMETFSSDGETGDLGLYQVWRVASHVNPV